MMLCEEDVTVGARGRYSLNVLVLAGTPQARYPAFCCCDVYVICMCRKLLIRRKGLFWLMVSEV